MADPKSPDRNPKVTPAARGAESQGDPSFPDNVLALIVAMLSSAPSLELTEAVKTLFEQRGIEDWDGIAVNSIDEVKAMVEGHNALSKVLSNTRLVKLLTIFEYAALGGNVVTTSTTFTEIRNAVRDFKARKTAGSTVVGPNSDVDQGSMNNGSGMVQTPAAGNRGYQTPGRAEDKPSDVAVAETHSEVPKLPNFSGVDEDYEKWQQAMVDALGTARGLLEFIEDPEVVTRYPKVAKSVFFGIRKAIRNGFASHFANQSSWKRITI